MKEIVTPQLWSDFDGTAVEIKGKLDPRNWLKYPLPIIDGYEDFLDGVTNGGMEIAGIVSRRPEIRRLVTKKSIAKLGLQSYFPDSNKVHLMGSEDDKAGFIADKALRLGSVAMIDDKPHQFGLSLVESLDVYPEPNMHRNVVLGVVNHSKSPEYIERFFDETSKNLWVNTAQADDGLLVSGLGFNVHVVALDPYSYETGRSFAKIVNNQQ